VRPGRKRSSEQPWAHLAPLLGLRLRQVREQRSMTRDKLGSDSGTATSTIAKLESGRVSEPGLFTVWAICRALRYDFGELVDSLEGDPSEPETGPSGM
jgi:transcriptional regulator with XRE-family HTH domain